MSGVGGLSSSEVVLGDGVTCRGWWLVEDEGDGLGHIVAGPFADRADASWASVNVRSGSVRCVAAAASDGESMARLGRADNTETASCWPMIRAWRLVAPLTSR